MASSNLSHVPLGLPIFVLLGCGDVPGGAEAGTIEAGTTETDGTETDGTETDGTETDGTETGGGDCLPGETRLFYDLPISSNCPAHGMERLCVEGAWEGDLAYQFESCETQGSPSYSTSFESLDDFDGFYIIPPGHMGTTYHELSAQQVHSGNLAHKAWFEGVNPVIAGENTNHRGYPTIQLSRTEGIYLGRVVVEFWVWLDITLEALPNHDWFSFATFTSYDDDYWQRTQLVNLDPQGFVHLMHVPTQGTLVHDIFQTDTITFPQQQWVKLTVLLDYSTDNPYASPFARVWQDDMLVSSARFSPRLTEADAVQGADLPCVQAWDGVSIESLEESCGLVYAGDGLAQAHFGMYAPPLLSAGVVFNDDLTVSVAP